MGYSIISLFLIVVYSVFGKIGIVDIYSVLVGIIETRTVSLVIEVVLFSISSVFWLIGVKEAFSVVSFV